MNVIETIAKRLPRMWDWIVLTVFLFGLVWWLAPQQMQVVLYKALLVSLASVIAYWVDHSLRANFIKRMTESPPDAVVAAIVVSRALIFLGCVLGMTLGL